MKNIRIYRLIDLQIDVMVSETKPTPTSQYLSLISRLTAKYFLQIILFPCTLFAQDSLPGMSYKQLIRQGNKDFKQAYYYDAISYYNEALKRDTGTLEVLQNLGMANYRIRDYKQALNWFSQAAAKDEGCLTTSLYYKGVMQKIAGDYKQALESFNRFAASYKGKDNLVKGFVPSDILGCYDIKTIEDTFVVKHLPPNINSGYSDLSPAVLQKRLFFASIYSDTLVYAKPDTGYQQPNMQLYASKMEDSVFSDPELFTDLDLADKNLTNVSFSNDGRQIFFTLCVGELQQNNCAIWSAFYEEGAWQNTREVSEKINYPLHATTHPHLVQNADGSELLWFSSNQPGGLGGFDIWFSVREPGGKFQKPVNAGKVINTSRDEITPFFDDNASTLYFSSSGLVGRGGLDVFYSKFKDGKFALPKTLPEPLNSSYDESFYRLTERQKGFFVSNRPGVFSVKGETCCDDIFSFSIKKSIRPWLKLSAFDSTGNNIPFVRFEIKDENGKTLEDKEKSLLFYQLPANGKYFLNATKQDFFSTQKEIVIDSYNSTDTNEIALMMTAVEVNKIYRMNEIYFSYNSTELNYETKESLDTLANLLQQNPKLKIEIGSHTDARGDDDFNMTLSQQRAESVVAYLSQKGIATARLTAKGYGETLLLQDCSTDADCGIYDCDCHKLNRRTEFKIVE
jgi:outer membrane protein OmpA-like peptidoglycan-associated protein